MNTLKRGPVDNLGSFLRTLAALPSCQASEDFFSDRLLRREKISGSGLFLSTGTASASENWAFVPAAFSEEEAASALAFFEAHKMPFIWPLFPWTGTNACRNILHELGLEEAGVLQAMSRRTVGAGTASPLLTFKAHGSQDEAGFWADAVWRSFGADTPAPLSFASLARYLASSKNIRLVTAFLDGEPAGAFLVHLDSSTAGIYYFAVMPCFRRRGVARGMMAEASRLALEAGRDTLVLQATPSGFLFYRSEGFETLFDIPLFSTSTDVF
ncbi:MAG: GNAT family N-acetyltransferase [Fretibacterium sp.]|nr:GNAT family N-acetyltransferase [Fretibacterium sp.]